MSLDNSKKNLTRDNFETVYKVFHSSKYGFGGNTSIYIAVIDENENKITGRRFSPMRDFPSSNKLTILKNNIAGFEEDKFAHMNIPEEVPEPTEKQLRKSYMNGQLTEDEFEEELDKIMSS